MGNDKIPKLAFRQKPKGYRDEGDNSEDDNGVSLILGGYMNTHIFKNTNGTG
jgi:hypothetical protein